jgi:hypothetical protein
MVVVELRQAVAAGLTERAAQRQLEQRLKIKLSQPQVKQQRAEQPALEFVPVAADEDSSAAVAGPSVPESAASASRPEANQLERALVGAAALTLAPGQSMPSRYLGLTLFYPALQAVGLLERQHDLGVDHRPSRPKVSTAEAARRHTRRRIYFATGNP